MTPSSNLSFFSLAALLLGAASPHAFATQPYAQIAQASPEGEQADERPADRGKRSRKDRSDAREPGADARDAPPPRERRAPRQKPERAPPEATPAQPEPPSPRARTKTPERASRPRPADAPAAEPPVKKKPPARTRAPEADAVPPRKAKEPPATAPARKRPQPDAEQPATQQAPPKAQPEAQQTPPKAQRAPKAAPDDGARPRRGREGGPREGRAPAAAPPKVKDLKELKEERKERSEEGGKRVLIEEPDNRVIVREGGRSIIRADEGERFRRLGGQQRREKRDGLDVTISVRPGGIEIFTENDDRGRPLRRYRRDRDGREVILFDNRDYYRRHRGGSFIDAIVDLPPPRITIPRRSYVVDYEDASDEDVYDALSAPPVERLERAYSLEEVRRSPNLRARMRRIDLDVINFDFGAWGVAPSQYPALERIADAMNRVIDRNPNEMFLIEGHTDAVGSDEDNLSLSDRRAETVAIILTEEFDVPPENLATQGYGEHYLKIDTQAAERQNRRVAVRRITPLISHGN